MGKYDSLDKLEIKTIYRVLTGLTKYDSVDKISQYIEGSPHMISKHRQIYIKNKLLTKKDKNGRGYKYDLTKKGINLLNALREIYV